MLDRIYQLNHERTVQDRNTPRDNGEGQERGQARGPGDAQVNQVPVGIRRLGNGRRAGRRGSVSPAAREPAGRADREAGAGDFSNVNRQSRFWCFVINNPEADAEMLLKEFISTGAASYLVYGREHFGPDQGTPHLQGYIEFKKKYRRSTVSAMPGLRRASVGTRYNDSTSAQAAAYCKKEGDFFEAGEISVSKQGKRSDLERVGEMLVEGSTVQEVARSYPVTFMKFHGGIFALKTALSAKLPKPPTQPSRWECPFPEIRTLVMFGQPGIGKTTAAKHWLGWESTLWVREMDDLGNFDTDVHKAILFDDVAFKHLPREIQIHIADWDDDSSIRIRYKLITIPAHTPKIITANFRQDPFMCDAAIERRVTYWEARLD